MSDALTFKILKNDLTTVLHRSVVRSAADASHRNKRVTFKPDVQEQINKLDTRQVVTNKNNPPKCEPRIINDDVSTRTRSKVDQNIGVSTRSKLQRAYKLSFQTLLFPLHDIIP